MTGANQAQAEYWASAAGLRWIEFEDALDTAMAGMLATVLDAAAISIGDRVLDIGCGTGASTMDAAARAAGGTVLGVDISRPLLDRARSRAAAGGVENISFHLADAQTDRLCGHAFDVLVSRLGMSFFSDTVAALENIAKSLHDGARMAFVSWAGVRDNPWFEIPKIAAEKRLGQKRLGRPPESDPDEPGPTAFRDPDRVAGMMKRAGLTGIVARPVSIVLTPPNGVRGAAAASSRVGPAARIMKAFGGTPADALAIEDAVAEAFSKFERDGEVRVPAVVNLFTCMT